MIFADCWIELRLSSSDHKALMLGKVVLVWLKMSAKMLEKIIKWLTVERSLKLGLIVIIWLHYQQLYTNVNRNILLLYIFFNQSQWSLVPATNTSTPLLTEIKFCFLSLRGFVSTFCSLSSSLNNSWIYANDARSSSLPRHLYIIFLRRNGMWISSSFLRRMASIRSRWWWTVVKEQKRSTITMARLKMSVRWS